MARTINAESNRGRVVECPSCHALFDWRIEARVEECPYCDEVLTREKPGEAAA